MNGGCFENLSCTYRAGNEKLTQSAAFMNHYYTSTDFSLNERESIKQTIYLRTLLSASEHDYLPHKGLLIFTLYPGNGRLT
jgi:hypothetical protein